MSVVLFLLHLCAFLKIESKRVSKRILNVKVIRRGGPFFVGTKSRYMFRVKRSKMALHTVGGEAIPGELSALKEGPSPSGADEASAVGSPAKEATPPSDAATQNRPKLTSLLLIVDYDGTNYSGWTGVENCSDIYLSATRNYKRAATEKKPKGESKCDSVQNVILNCLLKIHGYADQWDKHANDVKSNLKAFEFIGVSRTDKGVHAKEYVCQYVSYERPPPCEGNLQKVKMALNGLLNRDIRILGVLNAPSHDFNVRFNNWGKIYTYNFDTRIPSQPLERNYAWQLYDDPRFAFLLRESAKTKKNKKKEQREGGTRCQGSSVMTNELPDVDQNLSFLFGGHAAPDGPAASEAAICDDLHCGEEAAQPLTELPTELPTQPPPKPPTELPPKPPTPADVSHCVRIINRTGGSSSAIPCDVEKIKECCKLFLGRHSFELFRGTLKGTEKQKQVNPFCNISFLELHQLRSNIYQFVIQGDRFLYHMIRIIVGTLVQVGVGLLSYEDVRDALHFSKPLKVKLCAPAQGLCLTKILFPPAVQRGISASLLSR
ncbi:tRNA pseudouridine synthase, putative [Plasmodium vivax]|uniref:tRNA pseudouridine synthase n=2 Tax=Plasmodium vivax TaxID=5855 RepID=A0A0J9TTE0_PLAVI|nr:tRNA pseudouridine synthase [Plasmodium vivax North Korean]CAG9474937.1 unnamed protein product [Plasmodium vivax]SCO67737.1 tRNA pseudouridine synthase, putative [Plasmodium vivax]SCO73190.1 tRNA pseudouridine synthase, putative [Plasmodium vivax]